MAMFSRISSMCLRLLGASVLQTLSFVPLSKFLATPLIVGTVEPPAAQTLYCSFGTNYRNYSNLPNYSDLPAVSVGALVALRCYVTSPTLRLYFDESLFRVHVQSHFTPYRQVRVVSPSCENYRRRYAEFTTVCFCQSVSLCVSLCLYVRFFVRLDVFSSLETVSIFAHALRRQQSERAVLCLSAG